MSRLLTIKTRADYVPRFERSKNRTFDQSSGLAYTEVVSHAVPMRADWIWKSRGCTSDISNFRSIGPGCASLQNMAIRRTLLNLLSLTSESLETLPGVIGQKLWETIIAHELDSLFVWRVFAAAYPNEIEARTLKHRQHVVEKPNMGLLDYIKPITSTSFQWITFLTLSHVTCSRLDLINMSKLTNLGALTIGRGVKAPEVGLDDSIVRAWARAATEVGAFSMLRVLACRSQQVITAQSLSYLVGIPSLFLFAVEACSIGPQDKVRAYALGWKYRTGKILGEYLVNGGSANASWDSTMHSCFYQGSRFNATNLTVEGVEAVNAMPILHFCLGRTPEDAAIDVRGLPSMQFFQRIIQQVRRTPSTLMAVKRRLSGSRSNPPCKMRKMRAEQQGFEGILTEFAV